MSTTQNVPSVVADDELPAPPAVAQQAAGDQPAVEVSGEVSSDVFDLVTGQEPLPQGTYVFRLDEYRTRMDDAPKADEDPFGFGGQPAFMVFNACQQEPHVGHNFMEYVTWCTPEVFAAAMGPKDHPKTQAARKLVNSRLWKAKDILEGAGFKPSGKFDFKAFMDTHPEYKIQLKVVEKKAKTGRVDAQGNKIYEKTGQNVNQSVKYFPLNRPAA